MSINSFAFNSAVFANNTANRAVRGAKAVGVASAEAGSSFAAGWKYASETNKATGKAANWVSAADLAAAVNAQQQAAQNAEAAMRAEIEAQVRAEMRAAARKTARRSK